MAYLEYDTTIEGQVAEVVMIDKSNSQNSVLAYKFVRDIDAVDYVSRLVIEKTDNLLSSRIYEIEVLIITINGISSKVKLVIADFEAEYGYNKVDQSYEYVYGGTQIGKLSDNDRDGNTRLVITNNGFGIAQSYILIQEEEWSTLEATDIYTRSGSTYSNVGTKPDTFTQGIYYKHIEGFSLAYVRTINGHVTQWRLGEELPFSNLVNESDVKSNGMISLLNVARDTSVTVVFDVM